MCYSECMSENLRATVRAIKASGATSLSAIAKALQDRGIRTPAGNTTWHRAQVSRLLAGDEPASTEPTTSTESAQIELRTADDVTFCQVLDFPAPVTAELGFFVEDTPEQFSTTERVTPALEPEPLPSDSVAVEITADHAFLPTGEDGNVGPGWEHAADTERVEQGRRLMVPRAMADWLHDHRQAVILPAGAAIPPYCPSGTPGQ
jgi:hypothetical protein